MDHIEEAKQTLDSACILVSNLADDDARFRLGAAQAHALISIAESLATLAGCCTGDGEHIGRLHIIRHSEVE
jgi:hypothetical protein